MEELLEARAPKGQAYTTPAAGVVEVWEDNNKYIVQVTPETGETLRFNLDGRKATVKDGASVQAGDVLADKGQGKEPLISPVDGNAQLTKDAIVVVAEAGGAVRIEVPGDAEMLVKSGDRVAAGDRLTTGSLNLQDLLKYKGAEETARYIMNDVIAVYAAQGHEISAKHLEIIVRQMFSRVMIDEAGDSTFVSGDIVSKAAIIAENQRLEAAGKEPATYESLLLGITKVSIWSDSFLSAASFQDTTRVLINAAINGRVDRLNGLKENVIIGRKIPVGTGVKPLETALSQEDETLAETADMASGPSAEDIAEM